MERHAIGVEPEPAGKLAEGVRAGAWDVAFLAAVPHRAREIAFTAAYLEIEATYLVPAVGLAKITGKPFKVREILAAIRAALEA